MKIPASVNERNDICVEGFKMSLCYALPSFDIVLIP